MGEEQAPNEENKGLTAEDYKRLLDNSSLEELQKLELIFNIMRTNQEMGQEATKLGYEVTLEELKRELNASLESYKLWFEAYKSQNTLCSGAVVAFAAVTVGLIDDPSYIWLLGLSYAAILFSIVSTAMILHTLPLQMRIALSKKIDEEPEELSKWQRVKLGVARYGERALDIGSWFGFAGGLGLFLQFVNLNL